MTTLREAIDSLQRQVAERIADDALTPCTLSFERAQAVLAALTQAPVAWMLTDAQNPRVRFLEWQKETRAYSGEWIKTPLCTAPQISDRLARHGINPCPDCRGIGYDASGQTCWCQQNPSF